MAIDKSLNQAPLGLDSIVPDDFDSGLEIDIVDPEMVTLSDGSVEITLLQRCLGLPGLHLIHHKQHE